MPSGRRRTARASRTGPVPLVVVHAALLVAGAVAVSADPPAHGWAVLTCVVGYLVALVVVCRVTSRPDLLALVGFLVPVSIFQVLPDWILAEVLGTLRFPDTGGPRVDDVVPLAMAGMWVAPLFVALALSAGRPARAALYAVVVFAGAEVLAPALDLWEPVGDTTRMFGIAVYVLPAEAALGWAAAFAFNQVRTRSLPTRTAAALAVATFYLGALVLSYFVIDVATWRLTW
ncbi:hypothetical protein [Nocardioides sp. R-C-SC26]|uniref:DUF6989 domain-containing protein n=1 Tax=Nocardioides sp. R-C-SC26 TaxID=2870414 RepID=UPI001E3B50C4|nr:hypothetical protein [Nocardioides sp. R-C-SC26]